MFSGVSEAKPVEFLGQTKNMEQNPGDIPTPRVPGLDILFFGKTIFSGKQVDVLFCQSTQDVRICPAVQMRTKFWAHV